MRNKHILTSILIPLIGLSQSLSFSPDSNSVKAEPTQRTHQYSLLESSNLVDWSETQKVRGTESNLVFNINRDAPTKFFKTVSTEVLSPTERDVYYTSGDGHRERFISYDFQVVNSDNQNINANISWEETVNVYRFDYTNNLPFTQTLTPGTNNIHTAFHWISPYSGAVVEGKIKVEELP